MNAIHAGNAVTAPDSEGPRGSASSKPTHTAATMSVE